MEVNRFGDVTKVEISSLDEFLVRRNSVSLFYEIGVRFPVFSQFDMCVLNGNSIDSIEHAVDLDAVCVKAVG